MKKVNFAVLAFALSFAASQLIGCSTDLSAVNDANILNGQVKDSAFSQSAIKPVPGISPPASQNPEPLPSGSNPPCPNGPPPPFGVKHLESNPFAPPPCLPPPLPVCSGSPLSKPPLVSPFPNPSVHPTPVTSPSASAPANPGSGDVPAVFSKIYGATAIYREGNYVVITSDGRPEHKSPYYKNTVWESTLYEAYNGTGTFIANPNKIAEYALGIKIPVNPTMAVTHSKTQLGPMGIAVNGVAFFNQYAAGYSPLDNEKVSFDQYNGHPQQEDRYHYHEEPLAITSELGKSALLGFLLDGFPVYGPEENGKTITNADLDTYHGHFGVTADYPNGIYHYHTTSEAPYINGSGYYGTPGTVLK